MGGLGEGETVTTKPSTNGRDATEACPSRSGKSRQARGETRRGSALFKPLGGGEEGGKEMGEGLGALLASFFFKSLRNI